MSADPPDEDRAWPDPRPAGLSDVSDEAWSPGGQRPPDVDSGPDAADSLDAAAVSDLPTGPDQPAPAGLDLAQQALAAARAASRPPPIRRRQQRRRMTGPGADEHDPAPLGALVSRLITDRGWDRTLADAEVIGRWAELVGAEVAAHCRPVRLERGELTLTAESTAWATQLRLLAPTLLARLAAQVGAGVVTRVSVHGPSAPSWGHGRRRVLGRGPRDTYG